MKFLCSLCYVFPLELSFILQINQTSWKVFCFSLRHRKQHFPYSRYFVAEGPVECSEQPGCLYSILRYLTGSLIPAPWNNHRLSLMHTLKCVIIVSGVISHNYYKVIIITLVPRSSNYTPDPLHQVRYFSVTENFQSLSSQRRETGREIRKLQPIPWPVQEATASCAKDSISHRPIRPLQIFQNISRV